MDKKLLDIIACPLCKSPLRYDKARQELICKAERLAYPIRDGIPALRPDDGRAMGEDEPIPGA